MIGKVLDTAANFAPLLPLILKEGGSTEDTPKLAAGGAGKVRKGMLSKSGKILNAPIHARSYIAR